MSAGPPPTWQFACAAYIPLLTANLSFVGSGLIIYSVLGPGRSTKLRKPHHRMLLAMSVYDLLYSLAKAWTFLLAPAGYGVPGAMGNMTTCRMQGFFIELTHATGSYNALLSSYFYLSIVRGVRAETFAKYERIAHVLIFVIFVSFASVGVAIKLFNPAFGFCFIASYPPGCESGPDTPVCDRFPPQTMGLLYEIFAQFWIQMYMVVVTVTNVLIWNHIRQQKRIIDRLSPWGLEEAATTASGGAKARQNNFQQHKKVNRERMVAIQSTFYVVAFLSSWIGPTAFHLASWIGNYQSFWAVMVIVIFTPLQGFWNAFIYARPTYVRIRRRNPKLSGIQAAKMVFFDKDPLLNAGNAHGAVSAMSQPSKARLSVQETPTIRRLTASTKECQTQTHAELATKEVENTLKKDSFQDNEVIGDDTDQDDAPFEFDDCIDDDNEYTDMNKNQCK